ncbi:MAG: imelysin family protein [Reichenbachiella sp.]
MKNILKFSIVILILFVVISFIPSCDESTAPVSEIDDVKLSQLDAVYNNGILPYHQSFKTEAENLENALLSFKSDPTESNFDNVRSQWTVTTTEWKKCELFNFGPISDKFLHNRINKWPVDAEKIQTVLDDNTEFSTALVEGQGSNAVGLSAIEHLLFNDELSSSEMYIVFTSSQSNQDYAIVLAEQIAIRATEMVLDWQGYESEFTTNLSSGLDGGLTILLNALISHTEFLVYTKVGKPFGKSNDIINSEDTEAFRSYQSLDFIAINLDVIDKVFTGDFTPEGNRTGYEDFLYLAGREDLMITILDELALCKTDIESINNPLSTAITEEPVKVQKLYDDLIELLVLFKVDMANVLGSTVTFTDNDGD